jgi:hypothetical protein
MDPHDIRCICDLFNWEILLRQRKALVYKPFAAIKSGADDHCHLCSLLYGSLKVYHGPPGTAKLLPSCPCMIGNETEFVIKGDYNIVVIQVLCDKMEGQPHVARLDLSELPNTSLLFFAFSNFILLIEA